MSTHDMQDTTQSFVDLYQRVKGELFSADNAEALARRDSAISAFGDIGVPDRKSEEWKYTNLAPISKLTFDVDMAVRDLDRSVIEPFTLEGAAGPCLVFVNGHYSESLSTLTALPQGVSVERLQSDANLDELPSELLERCADLGPLPFARLNTAMTTGGAFIRVAKNIASVDPIQLIFITTADAAPIASFPRVAIVAEESAEVTVVENHIALEGASTLTVALTEIQADANAHVDHARTTELADGAYHIAAIAARQGRDSRVESCVVATGGEIARHDFRVVLDGDNGDCNIRGLAMLDGQEHVDNHLVVRHAKPNCTSREFFKNILDGASRGVFCGRIYVDQIAQKTDGVQTNANLLLSDDAQAETRPQLEIYADDVKCTHGATVGQLDEEAIFYLRARGVPESEARAMLVKGFAGEILDEIRIESLRDRLKDKLFNASHEANLLQSSV